MGQAHLTFSPSFQRLVLLRLLFSHSRRSQREIMESSAASSLSVTASSNSPSKRLLFDRRYGWVIDEWKDPSEEALVGGRGMFCILPLAKTLIKMASQSLLALWRILPAKLCRNDLSYVDYLDICFLGHGIENGRLQINAAANSAVKAFERRDLLSPQQLQAGLYDELRKIKSSLLKP